MRHFAFILYIFGPILVNNKNILNIANWRSKCHTLAGEGRWGDESCSCFLRMCNIREDALDVCTALLNVCEFREMRGGGTAVFLLWE